MLPTRLRNPRNHSLGSEFTKGNSGQAKTTDKPPSATALLATINESSGAGIARKLGKAFIVVLRLQSGPNGSILFHCLQLPFIPLNPGLLSHKESGN